MDNLSLVPTNGSGSTEKVSPWKRPGGVLGMVVAGAAIAGGAVLLYKILPWLITLTTNMITLTMLVVALGAILWIITDKNFQRMFSNIYFMVMRKLTGLVIELDPIAILTKKVSDMKDKIEEMKASIAKVNKQYISNKRKIEEKKQKMQRHLQRGAEYQKMGKMAEANLEATNANFAKQLLENYVKRNTDIEKWLEILTKLLEYAEFTVRKTESEVEFRKEEYESIKEQHKAFSSFKSIVKGSPDEMEDFTRAMDFMANDIDTKIGEMDFWLNSTNGIISEIDVEKGIMNKEAEKLLQMYNENGFENMFKAFTTQPEPVLEEKNQGMSFDLNNLKNNDLANSSKEVKSVNKYF